MAFNSKYTGKEVEDLLDKVNEGGGGTDLQYYSENTSAGTAAINAPNGVDISTTAFSIGTSSDASILDGDGYGFSVMGGIARIAGRYIYLNGEGATINNKPIATTEDLEGKQDKLNFYEESETEALIAVEKDVAAVQILNDSIELWGGADADTYVRMADDATNFYMPKGVSVQTYFSESKNAKFTYNGNEIATVKDLEDKQDTLKYYSELNTGSVSIEATRSLNLNGVRGVFIESTSGNVEITANGIASYNDKEIATVDMVDTALNTIKAALPSDTLLGFLDSWFASGKDYITSAEIVDYTEDTSMVRIRFTCEGYADEGTTDYFILTLENDGDMPITTTRGNTGTSEGYPVYGVFDIVVPITYFASIYSFSTLNQRYQLELSNKTTTLSTLRKAYPSSTLVSMVGSYWINQLSSHTQSTTIKIMDYDSETNSVRLRFYGRVTSNIQGLAIYESSSTKYLIQYVPRTATNYHVVFDLVVPFVNGEFLPFSTLLHVVDYV